METLGNSRSTRSRRKSGVRPILERMDSFSDPWLGRMRRRGIDDMASWAWLSKRFSLKSLYRIVCVFSRHILSGRTPMPGISGSVKIAWHKGFRNRGPCWAGAIHAQNSVEPAGAAAYNTVSFDPAGASPPVYRLKQNNLRSDHAQADGCHYWRIDFGPGRSGGRGRPGEFQAR